MRRGAGEHLQELHGDQGAHEPHALHWLRCGVAQVGIEVLLVMCGEMQVPEATGLGVALGGFHQLPAIPLAPQRPGNHYRFHKQALGLADYAGQPGVPKELGLCHLPFLGSLCGPLGFNQHQTHGEVVCGLLE